MKGLSPSLNKFLSSEFTELDCPLNTLQFVNEPHECGAIIVGTPRYSIGWNIVCVLKWNEDDSGKQTNVKGYFRRNDGKPMKQSDMIKEFALPNE